MNKWIRRKRNSRGFGIQSPNDFHFVQCVLREKAPYYAYVHIREMGKDIHTNRRNNKDKTTRLLFRLANYVHPETVVEIGTRTGISICAMAMGCPTGKYIAITSTERDNTQKTINKFPQITLRQGDEVALFKDTICKLGSIGILHITYTPHYKKIVEAALPYVTDSTLFVIEGLRECKEKRTWWKSLRDSPHTGTCYDIGNIGLIFFDKSRYKMTYWIKLRNR